MKRDLCFMDPIFSKKINVGDQVHLIYRNRKGKILYKGFGVVDSNGVDALVIDTNPESEEWNANNLFWVKAKEVYYGKHSLEYLGRDSK